MTAERRRYTKRQKAAAVADAEVTSLTAAAEKHGVPITTLDYWMDRPEFVELRKKTRDDLARGFELIAHRSQSVLMDKIPSMEPRDLTVLLGVATDKAQLLTGHATSRTESKSLTDGLDDHEKQVLRDLIDGAVAEPAEADPGADTVGAGAEVRQ